MKKIKVPKKSTTVEDKTGDLLDSLRTWSQTNARWLIGGGVGLFLIFVIYWGVNLHRESSERKAQQAYAQIIEQWPEGESADAAKYEKIVPELEKMIRENEGTRVALDAQVDLTRALFELKRYDDALKWGQKVQGEISSADNDLETTIRYLLANIYEKLGKTDEAAAQWTALKTKDPSALNREIYWRLAQIYQKKEQFKEAVEQYEKALETPGGYPGETLLQEGLAFSKSKTEASVAKSEDKSES